ncbi:DUF6673 family protein [Cellulosilyticum lentocellum]|uniref:DUF6673 domain-containing protein n=1 Tax=Cellulosilyticum lentocellum (strain ATCC 49066 / DSM 5427 / NCIMB 11756 / RHM5) TaxID=642492 RepID=F2JQ12_CELLD|nr:DUF6673 family protein [Cellulosilyticum lentocellum]ADZ82560.1 hypothetical protein Clole_0827 [Cellulosilyticum lentocellum DSM 5427]
MIKVNDVELNFDVMDAVQLENYEAALLKVKNTNPAKGLSASGRIKEQCNVVKTFFDEACGAGTAEALFGDSYNYRTHYEAFESFINMISEETKKEQKAMDERVAKYTLNRAQRRAK